MALPSRNPTLAEVMATWADSISKRIRVCMPVQVQSYDAGTQQVSVQPQIEDDWYDQNSELQSDVLPIISNVPVQFHRGGALRITFPIQAGDTGVILCSDRSLDQWLALQTPTSQPSDDLRRHHIQDAIYVPGVNVAGQAWTTADPSVITLGSDSGLADFVATAQKTLT